MIYCIGIDKVVDSLRAIVYYLVNKLNLKLCRDENYQFSKHQ